MPPSLARILYLALILWLLYRNYKTSRGLSSGWWLPFLWLGVIASKPLAYWFEGQDSSADLETVLDGSPIDRNLYLVLVVLGMVVLARRRIDWKRVFSQNRWIWLLHVYLLISVVWSDHPFVSFKRWFKDFGNVLMILIIITEQNPVAAIHRSFSVCPYVLVPLSVLFVKYYPAIGKYYDRWLGTDYSCGVTTNKNSLGVLAMISGLYLIWRLAETRKQPPGKAKTISMCADALALLMSVWVLTVAHSATSLVGFVVGTAVFFGSHLKWVKGNLRMLGFYAGGFALLSLLFVAVPELRKLVVGSLGRDVTLTGRTIIWEAVLASKTNPLIGTGFGSYWLRSDAIKVAQDWAITQAHNGYLETYLNSGLIGVFLLFAVLISAGRNALKLLSTGQILGHFYLALFLSGLIYNYTEATFNLNNLVGFCLWLLAMRYARATSLRMRPTKIAAELPQGGPSDPTPGGSRAEAVI